MTSMDDVMIRMSDSVITTPVTPAMVVNRTMVGFWGTERRTHPLYINIYIYIYMYVDTYVAACRHSV